MSISVLSRLSLPKPFSFPFNVYKSSVSSCPSARSSRLQLNILYSSPSTASFTRRLSVVFSHFSAAFSFSFMSWGSKIFLEMDCLSGSTAITVARQYRIASNNSFLNSHSCPVNNSLNYCTKKSKNFKNSRWSPNYSSCISKTPSLKLSIFLNKLMVSI